MLEQAHKGLEADQETPAMRHWLYLLCIGFGASLAAAKLAVLLPQTGEILSTGTWHILLVTTFGLILSATPARKIPGSHEMAMALVYLFVANMGAKCNLANLKDQALWFLAGAYLWICMHGLFCVLSARLLHVDIHSAAIASAANIGGAASAPIVAAHHNPRLVPVSILMALLGYAMGTYGAYLTACLCGWVSRM